MDNIIGKRIKYFRIRSKMSQIDLELAISASNGSISRIENGDTNPTKETISNIVGVLKLNDREISYISGSMMQPASSEEIYNAVNEVQDYFNQRGVLAYLVDDRYRLILLSKSFHKVLELDPKLVEAHRFRSFVSMIIDDTFKIKRFLDPETYEETIQNMLGRFYKEMGFMTEDQYYKEALQSITSNPLSKKIWSNIIRSEQNPVLHQQDKRKVTFKIGGMTVPLFYSIEALLSNRRFEIIEYTHTNILNKLLAKYIL